MIVGLILLLAAPERVQIVARNVEKPGFFETFGRKTSEMWKRLYQKNDPDVAEGNALAAQNDAEGALKAYDRAHERLAESPELHFNRAGQLLKLGSEQAKSAHEESMAAMQTGDAKLKSKAAFDLGLSNEALGNVDDAIKAYQQSLALDPEDPDAKANLELLLKQEERKKQTPQQQKEQSQQKNEQQKEQPDKSKGDEQKQQSQQQKGDQKEEKKEEQKQQAGEEQQQKPEEKKQQQAAEEQKPVDRSEAERLLDALRAGEKNLQAWRFAKDKRKEARRGDVEKDW